MIVEILCGGYGCPTKTGVHTVAHGERCEVSDAEAARLIGLGVAKCAFSAPTAPETAPADVPATAEGNDTPAAEASQNGSEAAHLDPDQLQSMTVAELKKLAADMGIETKQLKTKDPHQSEKFFAEVGLVTGDGGVWLRRQVLAMAQVNCTPAPYWLEMPLYQFRQWIRSSNDLIAERQRARKDGK